MGHKPGSNVTVEEIRKDYSLTYLDSRLPVGDTSENNADFIRDINTFKVNLPYFHVPRIELEQCWSRKRHALRLSMDV